MTKAAPRAHRMALAATPREHRMALAVSEEEAAALMQRMARELLKSADTIDDHRRRLGERGEAASQLTITLPELTRLLRPAPMVRRVRRDSNGDISEVVDVPAEPA